MSDFKARMHQIRFPRPRWGSFQRSPDPLDRFKGPLRGREETGEDGESEGRGM